MTSEVIDGRPRVQQHDGDTPREEQEMTYFDAPDGTRLFYKDLGAGPAILFVHAWSLNSAMWEYQMAAALDAGYRCVALDRRGHGRSDVASDGYHLDGLADDLAALVDRLGLTRFAVVAHSLGVAEVVRLISRRPDLQVERLVFSGSVTPGAAAAAGSPLVEDTIAQLRADRPGWFRAGGDAYFGLPGAVISPGVVEDTLVNILQTPLEVQEVCLRTMLAVDAARELAGITQPVLLLHGDRDASCALDLTGRPTAALLVDADLRVYQGAGHGLYVTHKERYNADLLHFVGAPTDGRHPLSAGSVGRP
jgi:pimeloyl-ACP methyl ester carboxylesterase